MSDEEHKKEETEFSRRRNMSTVTEVQHMNTKRTSDVLVKVGGKTIAARSEYLKRGKVVTTSYFLPDLDKP